VIGATADDARTKPLKIGTGSGGIGLTVDLPGAIGREELTEILAGVAADAGTTVREFVGPHKHLEIFLGGNVGSGFEEDAVEAAVGEDFRGHAAARAGTNDADIILLR